MLVFLFSAGLCIYMSFYCKGFYFVQCFEKLPLKALYEITFYIVSRFEEMTTSGNIDHCDVFSDPRKSVNTYMDIIKSYRKNSFRLMLCTIKIQRPQICINTGYTEVGDALTWKSKLFQSLRYNFKKYTLIILKLLGNVLWTNILKVELFVRP